MVKNKISVIALLLILFTLLGPGTAQASPRLTDISVNNLDIAQEGSIDWAGEDPFNARILLVDTYYRSDLKLFVDGGDHNGRQFGKASSFQLLVNSDSVGETSEGPASWLLSATTGSGSAVDVYGYSDPNSQSTLTLNSSGEDVDTSINTLQGTTFFVEGADGSIDLNGATTVTGNFQTNGLTGIGPAAVKTISGGTLAVTQTNILVETEGGAATDNLDCISGGQEGDVIYLHSASPSRDTTIRFGVCNIIGKGTSFTLTAKADLVALRHLGPFWVPEVLMDNN